MKRSEFASDQKLFDELCSRYMSILDASKELKITPQTIYNIVKTNRARSVRILGRIWVSRSDMKNYLKHSHKSEPKDNNGKSLLERGYLTIKNFSEISGFAKSIIYYHLYKGNIVSKKYGSVIAIHEREIEIMKHRMRKK